MEIKVLNKNKDTIPENSTYIGRPSKWGNPFVMRSENDRDSVCDQYQKWLYSQPELMIAAVKELRDKNLVCYCAPRRCHGDTLMVVSKKTKLLDYQSYIVEDTRIEDYLSDGISHINMYSKAKTELGKMLSHFSQLGFVHPDYGTFGSLESYWYWCSTGKKYDQLKELHGFNAKSIGRGFPKVQYEGFQKDIEVGIELRFLQNTHFLELFKNSTLPLKHYYLYGIGPDVKAVFPKESSWLEGYYEKLRKKFKGLLIGKNLKVIVAGSRSIDSYTIVKKAIEDSNFDVAEIVSGTANGVDTLGFIYSTLKKISVKEFPADWDKHGKSAGYIRNKTMAQYADALILIWDGDSDGSRNMLEIMKSMNKPYFVINLKNKHV